jgi:hypothetical protein
MKTMVIYPGRFQPAHLGHKSSYDAIAKRFGADNVYVVTSNVVAPIKNPFSFEDKVLMWTKMGVPASHIVQVRNPYQAQEIVKDIPDPENTALVFAVSQKDMEGVESRFKFGTKKNGEPSYIQPYPEKGKKLQPLTKHAYVIITPTTTFKVRGRDANSASAIRDMYSNGSAGDREQIIHDLYGIDDSHIKDIFDKKLGVGKKTRDIVIQEPPVDANVLDTPAPLQREHKEKLKKLLESTIYAERIAQHCYRPFREDLVLDYIDERNHHITY